MIEITLLKVFVAVGFLKMLSITYSIGIFIIHHLFTRGHDMITRYGKGTWAIVTGSSDGIGAEYAKLLARKGFNVCLVSRTESKLKKV